MVSVSMREEFQKWLLKSNSRKYSPEVLLTCIDRISEYAIRKKISLRSLWEYTNHDAFKPVYNKLIETKLLRLTERNTHKVFIVAGQFYLCFLKEKPYARKAEINAITEEKRAESAVVPVASSQGAIDPEAVIVWLITQPNANGTLYLENVARQYMSALRTAPSKLDIPVALDSRSVFTCHTPEELNSYWDICKAAPNYKQVNIGTSGAFSAGMGCMLKYLQHLSNTPNTSTEAESVVIQLIKCHGLEYVDKRDSGGALWIIGGRKLAATVLELRDSGFTLTFKDGGGRSSSYRDAWWYKSSEPVNEQSPEGRKKHSPSMQSRMNTPFQQSK